MAASDREGLCEVPFYSNLDRVALELLRPGLAPTQRDDLLETSGE